MHQRNNKKLELTESIEFVKSSLKFTVSMQAVETQSTG